MRAADCILIRVGEQALKSKRTQRRWWTILLNNIRAALQSKQIKFTIESSMNRIFIYTSQITHAISALKKVFGITSFSPCWTCYAGLDEIKLLATDIASEVLKLNQNKSFAIRARRAGRHKFTSRTIEEDVGAAVKRVTGAAVNLTKPNNTIWIEVRSRKAYIFVEKIQAAGGLPVGTAGKVLAIVNDKGSALAAWFIARRGAQLCLLARGQGKKYIDALREWHKGRKVEILKDGLADNVKKLGLKAIVTGNKISSKDAKEIKHLKLLHLQPLVALSKEELSKFFKRAEL